MDTNETSAFDFYYFIGGEDVDVMPPPQQETFFSFTEALNFAQEWAENRRKFEQSTTWRIDYCLDGAGVVMIAHSDPERCQVTDDERIELGWLETAIRVGTELGYADHLAAKRLRAKLLQALLDRASITALANN